MITDNERAELAEIVRLLREAYDHYFASTARALEAVRGWHAKEMAYDPATAWDEEDN